VKSKTNLKTIGAMAALFFALQPLSAHADWRDKLGTFRVGIVDGGRPILEARRAKPFAEALSKALSMPVEIFTASDHKTLIDAQIENRVEYAVYSATAFSAAWVLCKCVEPLAVPIAQDGSKSFRSVLIARKSQGSSILSLRGKTIAVPGADSFSGYILPKYLMSLKNIDLESGAWEVRDLQNADAAIETYVKKDAQALFGWEPTKSQVNSDQAVTNQATLSLLGKAASNSRIIWRSPEIPNGPHTVRNGLDSEARAILWDFLDQLLVSDINAYDAIAPKWGGGFAPVARQDYQTVIDLVEGNSQLTEVTATPSVEEPKKLERGLEEIAGDGQKKSP
jgi:phosphonate transport system substrate-binding protein